MNKPDMIVAVHQALAPWHGSIAPALGTQASYDALLAAVADKILESLAAEQTYEYNDSSGKYRRLVGEWEKYDAAT